MSERVLYSVIVHGYDFERPESLGEAEYKRRTDVNTQTKEEVRALALGLDPDAVITNMNMTSAPTQFFVRTTPEVAVRISMHSKVKSMDASKRVTTAAGGEGQNG